MIKKTIFIILALLFASTSFAGTAKQVDFLLNGYRHPTSDAILSGGKVYTYLDGTTTLSALYTDKDQGGAAANPIVLGSDGRSEVYGSAIYKFRIYTSGDVFVEELTGLNYQTPVSGVSLDDAYACDMAAAVAGSPTATLVADCEFTVASGTTVTIPSTMTLQYVRGGKGIGVAGGGTETLAYANGAQLIASWNQNIYGATIAVTYGTSIPEAFPEHFGDIDGTSDEVQINLAITALSKGDVVLNGQSYTVDASITGATNVNLRGREGITTINIGTADINAFFADTKTNITISEIKWTGTGANADTERLVYFDTCTDVEIHHCILTNTVIGGQFQTCTRAKAHHNTVTSIFRKTDFSEGYGFLVNLNNDTVDIAHNFFNGVARHCVYFSAGSSNCIAADNTAVDSTGGAFVANSTSAQNTMRNIQFVNNIVNGIQTAGGGADDIYGVICTGNIDGLLISGNQIYDNDVGGGIFVQHGALDTNTLKSVIISENIINTIDGGHGIWVINGEKIQVINNTIKAVDVAGATFHGIAVTASGTGVGSFLTDVLIEGNEVDTGVFGVSVGATDSTHKATGIVIGDNILTNQTTRTYNMGDIDNIEYKTTWDSFKPTFFVDNAAAAQTDTEVTAGNNSTPKTGTDTIASGATAKTVTHGLGYTPNAGSITIVGTEDPTNTVGTLWISAIGSTTFAVNVENDPGASNWDFTWAVAGSGGGYNSFVAPFSGFLYSVYGRVNAAITNEAILLELKLAGSGQTEGVTISAGDLYEKAVFGIGGTSAGKIQPITEGEIIQMQYTTAAGYLPVTLEVVGGFEIIRDINQ